jgi:hypothetical protein
MLTSPIQRSVRLVSDFSAARFENVDINMVDLYLAGAAEGIGLIRDRTFVGCRLQGPAILLISAGVDFSNCNFGDSGGGIRNLVLWPAGDRALGTVPLRDCKFEGCEFFNVGFTGNRTFLEDLISLEAGQA